MSTDVDFIAVNLLCLSLYLCLDACDVFSCPWAQVIEKMDPHASACRWEGVGNNTTPTDETVQFQFDTSLASVSMLQAWSSLMVSPSPNGSDVFIQLAPIYVVNGIFEVALKLNHIYTFTSLTQGRKGSFGPIPNITGFFGKLPNPAAGYVDNFDRYNLSREAAYFSDMAGSWEIVEAADANHGKVK